MPRPQPKSAEPHFIAQGYPLRDADRDALLALLGYDANTLRDAASPGYRKLGSQAGALLPLQRNLDYVPLPKDPYQATRDVETALGLYTNGAHNLDNTPRAADYREVFRPVKREALKLFKTLNNLSPYYRDQLDVHGANVHDIRDALGKLAGGAGDIVAAFQGVSSKGAPRNVAVMEVIRRLKRTFRDYYQGPRDLRKRRGAFQFLATWERTELSFIALALRSARISFTDQALQRLLRDPRCALPQERAQTIETIARKAHSTPPQQKRNKR